jgi:hypothetical protein
MGCAVSESDIRRWETTEHGPKKLCAVVEHDKYSWDLRREAALSLVRMKPRGGRYVGLLGEDNKEDPVPGLLKSLEKLREEDRKRIVNEIAPVLIEQMKQPPGPKEKDNQIAPDPSVPYKDAAFALLTNKPALISDDKTRADLQAGVLHWVQTEFEQRIDNRAQVFDVEKVMREKMFSVEAVRPLPNLIREESTKIDRITTLVAELGDDETKKRAGDQLVALAKVIDSQAWIDKQRPIVEEANKRAKITATPEQVTDQLKKFQEQELEKIFANMKKVGGRSVIDFSLAHALDQKKSEEARVRALAAIENRIKEDPPSDLDKLFDIVKDDKNPDKVRALALARMGELPKEKIVPKLYTLFDKKWQLRLDAAKKIIGTMSTKDIPDFMRHLPKTEKEKMALSEPVAYGALILGMDPKDGPKPRDQLNQFLSAREIGPKLTAIGSYYGAKKADQAAIKHLENDTQAVPKCEQADNCGWECSIPKADKPNERESKPVTNVGEFVRFCIYPSADGS